MPTLKELYYSALSIHACNKDKVYYLMKYKGRAAWRTIDQIDDCANMICFVKNENFGMTELTELIKCLKERTPVQFDNYKVQNLPKDVDYLQITTFIPTIEDDKMWTHDLSWIDVQL